MVAAVEVVDVEEDDDDEVEVEELVGAAPFRLVMSVRIAAWSEAMVDSSVEVIFESVIA